MFCKLGTSCAVKGLLISSIFMVALVFANSGLFDNQTPKSPSTLGLSDNQRIETRSRENLSNITINLDNHSSSIFGYLIQLLFWAFFISPPVIVVLLLVIISKMNSKNSIK